MSAGRYEQYTANTPMADAAKPLDALVKSWRDEWPLGDDMDQSYAIHALAIHHCAEELESALAAHTSQPQGAREALKWCLENLPDGIEWGGPYDNEHKQGVYHCTHCDARWNPDPDAELHNEGCGLVKARAALKGANL